MRFVKTAIRLTQKTNLTENNTLHLLILVSNLLKSKNMSNLNHTLKITRTDSWNQGEKKSIVEIYG